MKKKTLLLLLPLTLFACSDDNLNDIPEQPANTPTEEVTLTRATLTAIPSSQDRVTYALNTKATSELELIAEIANPSKEPEFSNLVSADPEKFLSATSVYYDGANSNYYVTYHMQGNNYHKPNVTDEVSGIVEKFSITTSTGDNSFPYEIAESGHVLYTAENPTELDFDFNDFYFDTENNKTIVVGHNWKPSSDSDKPGNTAAIIAQVSFPDTGNGVLEFSKITTGERLYDANGAAVDHVGAGDANSVVWNGSNYYVATRRGVAVLDKDFNLVDGKGSFASTLGSAKYVALDGNGVKVLYINEPHPDSYGYATDLAAFIGTVTYTSGTEDAEGSTTIEGAALPNNISISPIDGKNVLVVDGENTFACLGTGGLYYKLGDAEGVVKRFGSYEGTASNPKYGTGRPVNGVAVEDNYVFVANGNCLTILDSSNNMKKVAEYTAPVNKEFVGGDESGEYNTEDYVYRTASANYVHVTKAGGVYTVVVAYGQDGVRIFNFTPTPAE